VLIAVGLPAVAFPLYARLGQPRLPDEPLVSRKVAPRSNGEIEAAVAAVEARLIAKPEDGKGWAVIAPVYMRFERYADAAHAYSEALRILGEDPLRRAAYGEALVAAAGGVVTDEARQAFDRAVTDQPGQPQARYYLALATEQDGKKADAIRDYQSLLADSAPDAPWRSLVSARLAALKGEPAPATDAAVIPEAQRPMIEGMVSRLAERLASNGGSIDEWSRLIRAYTVLHEADRAKAALVDAHKALASDAGAVASLDALARDLGLGDAN
jgi:cytochrome c-type biogenesis protein CcmH